MRLEHPELGIFLRAIEESFDQFSLPPTGALSRALGIELFSEDNSDRSVVDLLAHLVASGQAFPSAIENSARASAIAARLGYKADSLKTLANLAEKLVYASSTEELRLVHVMRDEVDWTLEAAVGLLSPTRPTVQHEQ